MTLNSADTIVAVATASGNAAIGIVKVSGPQAQAIATAVTGRQLQPRQANYLPFLGADQAVLDHGIAIFFAAPDSYTGDDVVEFQAHGNPLILDQLVARSLQLGARSASPGEYTLRAFLNDRIDLAQAEAVADLVNSASVEAVGAALRSLQGEFSRQVARAVQQLIEIRVYLEAALDFAEEEIDFLSDRQFIDRFEQLLTDLDIILVRAQQGRVLKDGLTIAIIGAPNAGKSSVLNRLTGEDSAIVTAIAGTTRDVLREQIVLDGVPINIVDTAGLRDSHDPIEQEGIRRAHAQLELADLAMLVAVAGETQNPSWLPASVLDGKAVLKVYNKIDLCPQWNAPEPSALTVSALTGQGFDTLEAALKQAAGFEKTPEGAFMARRRHLDALHTARAGIAQAQDLLGQSGYPELAAEELRLVQRHLEAITGQYSSDDLLGEIFSSFCIGK